MDLRCCHHPDRDAQGTCCYCERALCDECLTRNKQGKSYCKREDDCLAFQDDLAAPGEPASPIVDYLTDTYSLDAQARRLSDILQELGESTELLEDVGQSSSVEEGPKIPGFCAHKLAEEGAALLSLISFRVDCIQWDQERSGDCEPSARVKEVRDFIEQEAEPKIRAVLDRAGPYGELDVSELLASLEASAKETA
jgi:hypothetical protein